MIAPEAAKPDYPLNKITPQLLAGALPFVPHPFRPHGTPVAHSLDFSDEAASLETVAHAIAKVHGDGNLPKIPVQILSRVGKNGEQAEYRYRSDTGTASRVVVDKKAHTPEFSTLHEVGHFLSHKGFVFPDTDEADFSTQNLHFDQPTALQPPTGKSCIEP